MKIDSYKPCDQLPCRSGVGEMKLEDESSKFSPNFSPNRFEKSSGKIFYSSPVEQKIDGAPKFSELTICISLQVAGHE